MVLDLRKMSLAINFTLEREIFSTVNSGRILEKLFSLILMEYVQRIYGSFDPKTALTKLFCFTFSRISNL